MSSGNSDCDRIEVLFNPVKKMIYIRPAEKDAAGAQTLRWRKDDKRMQRCSAKALCSAIFECMNWTPENKYKLIGDVCSIGSVRYMGFYLPDPIVCVNMRKLKSESECPDRVYNLEKNHAFQGGLTMIALLCIILFPFVVLSELIKLNDGRGHRR